MSHFGTVCNGNNSLLRRVRYRHFTDSTTLNSNIHRLHQFNPVSITIQNQTALNRNRANRAIGCHNARVSIRIFQNNTIFYVGIGNVHRIWSTATNQQASLYGHTIQRHVAFSDAVRQNQVAADRRIRQRRARGADYNVTRIHLRNRLCLTDVIADQRVHNLGKFSTGNAALGIELSIRTADIFARNQRCYTSTCPVRDRIAVGKCVQS